MASMRALICRTLRSAAALSALAGFGACNKAQPVTDILLSVTSARPVDKLELRARNMDLVTDTITRVVETDISTDPYLVLIHPSPQFPTKFLIHVKGTKAGKLVSVNAKILEFKKNQQVAETLRLMTPEDFVDADDDGFPLCRAGTASELCDCNDQNPDVSPFRHEFCDKARVDNNCNGSWRDECDHCLPSDPELPCTPLGQDLIALAGVGACVFGQLPCVDGVYGTDCIGAGSPKVEVPNNYIDDDCDGTVDEGSGCTPGRIRACHRGFVDDATNPDPNARGAATALAMGECSKPGTQHQPRGVQKCLIDGTWGMCEGDALPQRETLPDVGWTELQATQCDGLDNDCNGLYDDKEYFDADADGYTICGSVYATPAHSQPGLGAEYIDCNDADPNINPGATELCGNEVDEDCRCDHDPLGRPVSDPLSAIGKPYNKLGAGVNCDTAQRYLVCPDLPRSDTHATGVCKDAPDTYYRGYFTPAAPGSKKGCYMCSEPFGLHCSGTTQACTTKDEDCIVCDQVGEPPATDLASVRPLCQDEAPGTCSVRSGPAWQDLVGTDPYDECAGVLCSGANAYYWGIATAAMSPLIAHRCYQVVDQSNADVLCKAGGACQTSLDLCPLELVAADWPLSIVSVKSTFVVPPFKCEQPRVNTCAGWAGPAWDPQVNTDWFEECTLASPYKCSALATKYYFGVLTDGNGAPHCYYKADVSNNDCATGGSLRADPCQTLDEACRLAAQGAEEPNRPRCMKPVTTSGCNTVAGQETVAPVYTAVVAQFTDPYNECAANGGAATCNGLPWPNNACSQQQGDACDATHLCESGVSCVDGVCCGQASCPVCEYCAAGSGTCQQRAVGAKDPAGFLGDLNTCNTASHYCCPGATAVCVVAGGEYGASCGTPGGDCASAYTCVGTTPSCGAASRPCAACSGDTRQSGICQADGTTCTINPLLNADCAVCTHCQDDGTTASCPAYGQDIDDTASPFTCTTNTTCDGGGNCRLKDGQTCGSGTVCASGFCVDGVCCGTVCLGTCFACSLALNGTADGTCFAYKVYGTDTNATTPCSGSSGGCGGTNCECAASSTCKKGQGDGCGVASECANNLCVDSFCCSGACSGTCMACSNALTGSPNGSCANYNKVQTDTNATLPCMTGSGGCGTTNCTCTASGATCKRAQGEACGTDGALCASGNCVDGVCCGVSACGTCQTCNGTTPGACTALNDAVDPDTCNGTNYCCQGACVAGTWNAGCGSGVCTGTMHCSAASAACSTLGSTCYYCGTGATADRAFAVSCDATGTCPTTGGAGAECAACARCAVDSGCTSFYAHDAVDAIGTTTCQGTNVCAGGGATCLLKDGQACGTNGALCASSNCVDGVCCGVASCGQCQTCGGSSPGTCTALNDATDPGLCTGANYCCQGTCVAGTLNASCGSGACLGTMHCSAASAACNSLGATCYRCGAGATADRAFAVTCDSAGGCPTTGGTGAECAACVTCAVNTGCTSFYAHDAVDSIGTTTCQGANVCAGGGATCLLKDGQACGTNGALCASGNCIDGVCCGTPSCGPCQTCNGGTPGTCTGDVTNGPDTDSCNTAGAFCCSGNCITGLSGFGAVCGSTGCAGTWGCNAGAARCSSSGTGCFWCGTGSSADTSHGVTCSTTGTCPTSGGTTVECAACYRCATGTGCSTAFYTLGTTDTTGSNQCTGGTLTCNGSGTCL